MDVMAVAGTLSLAAGALAGWPLALLSRDRPPSGRVVLREPKRLLQVHLDWIMMGTLLLALGAAVPGLPAWVTALVVVGAVANPLLFLPLAVAGSGVRDRGWYRASAGISFTAMSVGLVGAAFVAA